MLAALQRTLLYFPDRYPMSEASERARALGLEPVRGASGDPLGFVRRDPRGAVGTLVVAHGNAGSALDRTYFACVVAAWPTPLDVLLLEYPGYGPRAGEPGEAANVGAVIAVVDRFRAEGRPVVLVGESLGSACVALAAAQRPRDVAAVVLVTPLPNLASVASHHYPFIPDALLRDRYEADRALARYPGRVAFVVAGEDEIIPARLAHAWYAAHPGPKRLWVEEGAGHNTLDYAPQSVVWSEVGTFVGEGL